MERIANNNLTIFGNHSYNVPEDVFGSVEKAVIKTQGADQDGNPNHDLVYDIVMNSANARAVETWTAVHDHGAKLGLSIGALIPEGGAKRQKDGSYAIQHLMLLETSIVGVPANTRSWVDYAVKALNKALTQKSRTTELGNPTLTLEDDRYRIEGSLQGLDVSLGLGNSSPTQVISSVEVTAFGDPEEVVLLEQAVEPDVTDARVRIIEVDTDEPQGSSGDGSSAQGASSSEPDAAEGGDTVVDSAAVEGELLQLSINQLRALALSATTQLVEARVQLAEAVRQRDEAVAAAAELVQRTSRVIERIGDTPLARKAALRDVKEEFSSSIAAYYGDEFAKAVGALPSPSH